MKAASFSCSFDEAYTGDECALLLDGIKGNEVNPGYVICENGNRNFTRKFNALVRMEPGVRVMTNTDIAVSAQINGTILPAHIRFSLDENVALDLSEPVAAIITLDLYTIVEPGTRIVLVSNGRAKGYGFAGENVK